MERNKNDVIVLTEEDRSKQIAEVIDNLAEELATSCENKQSVWYKRITAGDGVSNNPDTITDLIERLDLLSNRLPDYDAEKQGYLSWVIELVEKKLADRSCPDAPAIVETK